MPKIYPFLWFDTKAEEAANFYRSIFPNSKIGKMAGSGKFGPGPEGSVLTIGFSLDGKEFVGLNAGAAIQVYGSGFVRCSLQYAGRDRQLLVETDVRRRARELVRAG